MAEGPDVAVQSADRDEYGDKVEDEGHQADKSVDEQELAAGLHEEIDAFLGTRRDEPINFTQRNFFIWWYGYTADHVVHGRHLLNN
mgnify:FL=1